MHFKNETHIKKKWGGGLQGRRSKKREEITVKSESDKKNEENIFWCIFMACYLCGQS